MALPAHLTYRLSRRQRLIPHLKLWGPMGPAYVFFFAWSVFAAFASSGWFSLAAIVTLWFGRGYILGLFDVLARSTRPMDILIEPLGIGYLAAGDRWYVHMDGVLSIQELLSGVWTVSHHNGTVFNIPTDVMPDDCVDHIRNAIEHKWEYLQPFADEHKHKLDNAKAE